MPKTPILLLTHGGGPMPLLNDPAQADITHSLQTKVASALDKASPSAILLITAHWEEATTKVSSAAHPSLFYDYYGFPPEAYAFKYPAPGSPDLATRVISLLQKAGIQASADEERGWDHGVFVPLLLARPQADIPIVQMSVLSSQSPQDLFALGVALQPLREQGVAIVGSGSAAFHSIRNFSKAGSREFQALHKEWRGRLDGALKKESSRERLGELKGWKEWEGSGTMHPVGRTEHFSPAMVCAGAVGDLDGEGKVESWEDGMMGVTLMNWIWTGV